MKNLDGVRQNAINKAIVFNKYLTDPLSPNEPRTLVAPLHVIANGEAGSKERGWGEVKNT